MSYAIEKLKINFKTLEEFKKFREYGIQELSMLEDLQANIIENDHDSPFYGIFFGDKLVARMSLYKVNAKFNRYFEPVQDYYELKKLEVLPDFQKQGYGKALVEFAKAKGLPIRTVPRIQSKDFWKQMGFEPIRFDDERDIGEHSLLWKP